MAALADAKWMMVSAAVHRMIEDKGWANISMEHRPQLFAGLAHDLKLTHEMHEQAPPGLQDELSSEIKEAEKEFERLVAVP